LLVLKRNTSKLALYAHIMNDYYDLGTYSRPITSTSPQAQTWFDRGLNWTYGFNHEEAIRCFEKAIEHDDQCAMIHWGLAYAYGPYINKEWRFYAHDELVRKLPIMRQAVARANELAKEPVEKALAEALTVRYQSDIPLPSAEMDRWHDDFANAMRLVCEQFPQDRDAIALTVESMMMRTPWRLWDLKAGEPTAGADTLEMMQLLEGGMGLADAQNLPPHPGLCHMVVHTLEMSPFPERAMSAANDLRGLVPDSGHLNHMPTHIDTLCGKYHDAVIASGRAIAADKKYLAQLGPFKQYTAAVCHDNHQMMFASMFLGRWETAIGAADMIRNLVTDEVLLRSTPAFQITLESYVSMRMHVFIRFGKWEEIIDEPMPENPTLYPVTTAMHHYAKAIAQATLGDFEAAELERSKFEQTLAGISEERHLFNNTSHIILAIARQMMLGEIAYHQGDYEPAFAHLRQAVALNDGLFYTEPWAWMHPPRHALGALLLAQGRLDEAEAVYKADLGLDESVSRASQHPDNVWSLHGYVECLEKLGKGDEVVKWQPKLEAALALTDTPILSSCMCRKMDNSSASCCE
jgi:tetratricopeptide (TPR) repeat protein